MRVNGAPAHAPDGDAHEMRLNSVPTHSPKPVAISPKIGGWTSMRLGTVVHTYSLERQQELSAPASSTALLGILLR